MILHFGLQLDGMQPGPPRTVAGEAAVGPTRLLELLEVRLGLPPALARPGEALLAYRACLAELDDLARFYRASFERDSLAVAKTLLGWRRQWYEAGWTGRFNGPVSQRLADMAEVEHLALARTPPTPGQRLQRIRAALEGGAATQIERIVLHSELAELPAAWHTVLEHFAVEEAPGVAARPSAPPGTDLHRVQSTLAELANGDSGVRRERQTLARDGSVVLVHAISRDVSAQAIAEYVRNAGSPDDTVLIAEHDGIILDNALERAGCARAGFQHYSRFRAVAQVLKLALGLVWEPINPHALLQFLIHPVGPLPGYARSRLAEAVAREPGIGGRAWRAALELAAERARSADGRSDEQIATLVADIGYWLDGQRYDPAAGAPLGALIERTQRCATWLARRLHTPAADDSELELYAAARAQAEALIAALGQLLTHGQTTLPRISLERLVDEVGTQAADPATFAQAGHVRAATQPDAITTPWHTVIWWDLTPRLPPIGYPWSDAELGELAREGVALQPVAERIRHRVRTWLRPIMNASRRLVLVVHERDEGHHPLWSRLHSLFDGFEEVRIEDALLASPARASIPVLDVPLEPLPVKPLPAPRRWWQLPPECRIPVRETESYSSLRKIIDYPHEWVLAHAARLHTGRATDLPDHNKLAGNLAHRLFETFFDSHPDWAQLDERARRKWVAEFLPVLVRQEGALLLEPGASVARERVLAILEQSFERLIAHLHGARVESVAAEASASAPFADVRLDGTIDLLLRTRGGREIVLDVKWGSEDFRAAELAENRYLQLATYAYLRHAAGTKLGVGPASGLTTLSRTDPWPYYAYYIVSSGNVLAHDATVFPNAIVHAPAADEDIAALWTRIGASYEWRRAQIAANTVEVNAAGTEPTFESQPPAAALAPVDDPDRFDDFTLLTGWEPGA